jgi:hypothetical protein
VSEAEPGFKDVESRDRLACYRFEVVEPLIYLSESVFVLLISIADVVRVACGVVLDDRFVVVLFGVFSHEASVVWTRNQVGANLNLIGNSMVRSPTSRRSDALRS